MYKDVVGLVQIVSEKLKEMQKVATVPRLPYCTVGKKKSKYSYFSSGSVFNFLFKFFPNESRLDQSHRIVITKSTKNTIN